MNVCCWGNLHSLFTFSVLKESPINTDSLKMLPGKLQYLRRMLILTLKAMFHLESPNIYTCLLKLWLVDSLSTLILYFFIQDFMSKYIKILHFKIETVVCVCVSEQVSYECSFINSHTKLFLGIPRIISCIISSISFDCVGLWPVVYLSSLRK